MQAIERAGLSIARVGLRIKPRNCFATEAHRCQSCFAHMRALRHAQSHVGFRSQPCLSHRVGMARILVVCNHPEPNSRLRGRFRRGGRFGEFSRAHLMRWASSCHVLCVRRRIGGEVYNILDVYLYAFPVARLYSRAPHRNHIRRGLTWSASYCQIRCSLVPPPSTSCAPPLHAAPRQHGVGRDHYRTQPNH